MPIMPYSQIEIAEYARKIGKSVPTLWRWVRQGCDLQDPKSVAEWVTRNTIRETNISKARKRRRDNEQKAQRASAVPASDRSEVGGNGDLPPAGRKGAAAALERLERVEEESHRHLEAALKRGNPVEIQSAQEFWLRTAETLKRLDLAIEVSRRSLEEQVPKRLACNVAIKEQGKGAFNAYKEGVITRHSKYECRKACKPICCGRPMGIPGSCKPTPTWWTRP